MLPRCIRTISAPALGLWWRSAFRLSLLDADELMLKLADDGLQSSPVGVVASSCLRDLSQTLSIDVRLQFRLRLREVLFDDLSRSCHILIPSAVQISWLIMSMRWLGRQGESVGLWDYRAPVSSAFCVSSR